MIIIIAYLSQAYDWSIDQMIMLEICHKSCYTTMEKIINITVLKMN